MQDFQKTANAVQLWCHCLTMGTIAIIRSDSVVQCHGMSSISHPGMSSISLHDMSSISLLGMSSITLYGMSLISHLGENLMVHVPTFLGVTLILVDGKTFV